MKFLNKLYLVLIPLFVLSLFIPQRANAQLSQLVCGENVAAGSDGNLYTTRCRTGCVFNCGETVSYSGCGFGSNCHIDQPFLGCAGVDTSSCSEEFDSELCQAFTLGDEGVLFDGNNCSLILGGCFIPYPGLNGRGVCLPPVEETQLDCSNPPDNACLSSDFELCFDSADEVSDGGIAVCDCWESVPDIANGGFRSMCYFTDQESYDEAVEEYNQSQRPWGDDWCATCPLGYSPSYTSAGTWRCHADNANTNPFIVEPSNFSVCAESQYCELGAGRGGCEESPSGCRLLDPLFAECSSYMDEARSTSCVIGGDDYCCPDSQACTTAGGEIDECVSVPGSTFLAPGGGYLDVCQDAFPTRTIECVTSNAFNQSYACCRSVMACEAEGGDPPNNRGGGFQWVGCLNDADGVPTAFGCFNFRDLIRGVTSLVVFALGLGGGVALVLIAYAAFLIMFSGANPKMVQQGKEVLFSAIAGLVTIALSTWLLQLIGVDLLGLFG